MSRKRLFLVCCHEYSGKLPPLNDRVFWCFAIPVASLEGLSKSLGGRLDLSDHKQPQMWFNPDRFTEKWDGKELSLEKAEGDDSLENYEGVYFHIRGRKVFMSDPFYIMRNSKTGEVGFFLREVQIFHSIEEAVR